MLDVLLALWPLAIPVLVAAVAGDTAIRRYGMRSLLFTIASVFVLSVVTVTVIGVTAHQPVLSQVAAALVLYVVPFTLVALVLVIGARKHWPPLVAISCASLVAVLCMAPLAGPAIVAQGMFGGDTF